MMLIVDGAKLQIISTNNEVIDEIRRSIFVHILKGTFRSLIHSLVCSFLNSYFIDGVARNFNTLTLI